MQQDSEPGARLILASGSPRRRELLSRLGVKFEVAVSGVDEDLTGLSPAELVCRLAEDKARAATGFGPGWVLGADTTIDLDGVELAKPFDSEDARRMLRQLRGRWHLVLTGVAVLESGSGRMEVASVATSVKMRDYSEEEIRSYVATGEPMDKAGAYAIQGQGGELVERVEGCYFNVIGLPLCETVRLLTVCGFPAEFPRPVCLLPTGCPCPRLGDWPQGTGLAG